VKFSDFIFEKKLGKAASLLLADKKKSVSKIVESLGYLNLSYFSKIFKEKYGFTPSQYKKYHTLN